MPGNDHQLLVRDASRGDGAAIEALLERHWPGLLAYIRLHADPEIRRHESCADIAQSVCREALEDMAGFEYRGEAAFRKWLFVRALSKLINRKRYWLRERRDVGREQPLSRPKRRPSSRACTPASPRRARRPSPRRRPSGSRRRSPCCRTTTGR